MGNVSPHAKVGQMLGSQIAYLVICGLLISVRIKYRPLTMIYKT